MPHHTESDVAYHSSEACSILGANLALKKHLSLQLSSEAAIAIKRLCSRIEAQSRPHRCSLALVLSFLLRRYGWSPSRRSFEIVSAQAGAMSGIICAICYDVARPLCEDLQSISACGHVFHELCLQQWMEYCPTGRKASCPLCKQQCTVHDVHRLYFQSAGSDSTQPQGSPSRNLRTADPEQADNAPALRKLESQLAAAKTALQSRDEQLNELDSQVVSNLQRAENAEAANAVVKKELNQCKQVLTRVQKELNCCSNERTVLQEKYQAMATDLAAYKLIGDTDLSEEDIFRLANLGSGSNKNAIIESLTKSLILRNKSYKELMARCNALGMGESRALRKSEKTIEHLRKMKARVQELEKLLEEKDNASLRGLNRGNSKTQGEDGLSAQRPSDQVATKRINASRSPASDQPTNASTLSRGWDIASPQGKVADNVFKLPGFREGFDVMPRAELSDVQLPKIVKERGQMGVEHVQLVCPKNMNTSEENFCIRKRGRSEGATDLDHREDNTASTTGSSHWIIKSWHLLQKIELLNNSGRRIDQREAIREHPILASSNVVQVSLPRPGPTLRPIEKISSAVASSATCIDQVVLNPARVEHEVGTQSCTLISENFEHVNSPVVPPVNSFGAFAKRASSDRLSTSSSTFILSGADGRGGTVKVLKPPSLPLGGMAMSGPQRIKRPKMSGTGFRGTQGVLQMEHFFGPKNRN